MAQLPDYYADLGISRYASYEEITQKYHALLGQDPSEAEREKIKAAYEVLADLGKRQRYDFDQSIARIRGSFTDYVDEALDDRDSAPSKTETTLDSLMNQSRESFNKVTASLDDLMTGAEAISGQSGAALDDLIADRVEVPSETAITLDDLLSAVDPAPPAAVRARHPAAVPLPDAPPGKPQVKRAGHTVSVGGTVRRRPLPRSKSSPAKLPIIAAVVIMGISALMISFFRRVENYDSGATVSIVTFEPIVFPTLQPFPTLALPTAAVTRIQSEGNTNNTARPEPTELPVSPTASPTTRTVVITTSPEHFETVLDVIMAAHAQGLPISMAGMDLSNEVLPVVPLQNANLEGSNLQNTNLNAADLQNANLRAANLQGATLRKTLLQGADLTGASLENALLTGAFFSGDTILPDGSAWTEGADMARFTDPTHPDFWQPE